MVSRTLSLDSFDAWQGWFERLDDAGPYHGPTYMEILAGNFEYPSEHAELFIYGDEDAFVYYPYLRRPVSDLPFAEAALEDPGAYADIVSSWYYGGPLLGGDAGADLAAEFADAFSTYAEEDGIVSEFIRFDPNRRNYEKFKSLGPVFNRKTVRVDLTKSESQLWDEFEKRNRNAIRQAQETDLIVEPTTDRDDYDAFYDIYANAMRAKEASRHYRFNRNFFDQLLNINTLCSLLVARHQGDFVGGAVVVHDERIAHDYLRATDPDYWDLRVNNLLCYETMMLMRDREREIFDFQGGRPGVFKFKKGFSSVGRSEFYVATRTFHPKVYQALTDSASAYGINTETEYFPAYRKEQSN